MEFTERPGSWKTYFSQEDVEIHLAGDKSGPFPLSLEMAKACEAQLAHVMTLALAFIAESVTKSAGVTGEPWIVAIDFGLGLRPDEFEVIFNDAADYVLWRVQFSFRGISAKHEKTFWPRSFARGSW